MYTNVKRVFIFPSKWLLYLLHASMETSDYCAARLLSYEKGTRVGDLGLAWLLKKGDKADI